jgi:archaellum component FlaC
MANEVIIMANEVIFWYNYRKLIDNVYENLQRRMFQTIEKQKTLLARTCSPYDKNYNYDKISHNYDKISHNYGKISHNYGKISHNYDKISHNYDKISHNYGKISHNYDKISHNYGKRGHILV